MDTTIAALLTRERRFVVDLARAFGGALIFAVPMFMTQEMWRFGATMEPWRLIAFVALGLPLLYGLADYAGFDPRRSTTSDVLNTLTALAVGFATAAGLMALFNIIQPGSAPRDAVGQITIQAIPAAMGALLARKQLLPDDGQEEEDSASWLGEVFLMVAGALFLSLNIAPTEEVIRIAHTLSAWHALALALVSLVLLHALVFSVGFGGQQPADHPVSAFFQFTVVGYALALLVSLFMLWAIGRTDGQALGGVVSMTVVLGFPAALGAAVARLVI
ncbi:hypothetical protein BZG35_15900 [Brevundimonas sp. LM2]|uniref:TIGR02587 family membrane protein n=1 Tax=Brevundimonas sp. LM2 TaxID=1938605 RepID=UPI000983CB67|nr:TIGR02587 family membrane protein [Brevundimonas sp. LM2]AQR62973.1 hypothetical protein BZG35_15900 [Brevundimonas sp. LM2]